MSFATQMIPHHEQAVEMAELAATRAVNAEVKALAASIKDAQEPEIVTMTGWLTGWGAPVPTDDGHDMGDMGDAGLMDGMMSDAEMGSLGSASGAAFDRRWVELMIRHHEGAVAMATTESAQGQNADAKALAGLIATSQQAEITEMRALLATLPS